LNKQFQKIAINTISPPNQILTHRTRPTRPRIRLLQENEIDKCNISYTPLLRVREFSNKDQIHICSFVKSRKALLLVSGDSSDSLTPNILTNWISKAKVSLVISREPMNEPIGFCTLSRLEVDYIPASYIEICHLIINPTYRYMFIGPRLVREATFISREFGFRFICGRVVHNNRYGLILAKKQKFEEFTNTESWMPPGFRWFRLNLSAHQVEYTN